MSLARPFATALGFALLGQLPATASAGEGFTSTPLPAAQWLAEAAPAPADHAEGACGEGMCAASMRADADKARAEAPGAGTPAASGSTPPAKPEGKQDAEGACGEGKCGKM